MTEQSSTYFVQDRSNEQELARLVAQDRMFTTAMGGVFPEQNPAHRLNRVLDVGCGTGGWLIEVANTHQDIGTLVGIDISGKMLEYARTQAHAQGLDARVEFRVMDALLMLEFPDNYFDLVNIRFALSFLRTWDWPKMMQELIRVSKSNSVVRITETLMNGETNSLALSQLQEMLIQAFAQAGHTFSETMDVKLPQMMEQYGLEDVQTCFYRPEYTPATPEGQLCIEDLTRIFRTSLPFLRKWVAVPGNYEAIYQQMLYDVQQPDFKTQWPIFTCWGTRL